MCLRRAITRLRNWWNPSKKVSDERTDFFFGCHTGNSKLISENCEKMPITDLQEGFIILVRENHIEPVKKLILTKNLNLNLGLIEACKKGYFGMVELLLENGADPIVGLRNTNQTNLQNLLYRVRNDRERAQNDMLKLKNFAETNCILRESK